MLQITIPAKELWDESRERFITIKEQRLQLEHSLVSLSKWESKWNKPFLSTESRTLEETKDYVRCMTITQNVDPMVYEFITDDVIEQVNEYINAKMTATWFNEKKTGKPNNEQTTSEIIYYNMISLNIPFECQKWHLNRLLTLIRVCDIKNNPNPKKMSRKEILSQNAAINEARLRKLNTKG